METGGVAFMKETSLMISIISVITLFAVIVGVSILMTSAMCVGLISIFNVPFSDIMFIMIQCGCILYFSYLVIDQE